MRIKLSDGGQVARLVKFLAFDPNAMVKQTADDEIEVWFVGSLNVWAQQAETELRLRSWLAAHPDVVATMLD